MSIWLLFIVGVFSGILVFFAMKICSKQCETFIVTRMNNKNRFVREFLHDGASNDLLDIDVCWQERDSGESYTTDESRYSREEHGYWINTIIQEIEAYRPVLKITPPGILPSTNDNNSSSTYSNSSFSNSNVAKTLTIQNINISTHNVHMPPNLKLESELEVSMCEPWFLVNESKIHICKTMRRMFRVASNSFDNSDDSSGLSSITISDDDSSTKFNHEGKKVSIDDQLRLKNHIKTMKEFESDTTTVARGNRSKMSFNTSERQDKMNPTLSTNLV